MSSISSHDGSEKDLSFHKSEGLAARYAYLRKTDLLDTLETARPRDTDAWSVAATIDDQESVISGHGGGMTSVLSVDDGHAPSLKLNPDIPVLRDLDENMDNSSCLTGEDDDKRSRSNAAEFGDDAGRSATADFRSDTSSNMDEHEHAHTVVNDDITAPPQPQPSFASVTPKSYAELVQENEMLQSQIRSIRLMQEHQAEVIDKLRSLVENDQVGYDKTQHHHEPLTPAYTMARSEVTINQPTSVINARTLTHRLAQLAELLTRFAKDMVEGHWRIVLEQFLYSHIVELYLQSLPFGTENQELLNTAYTDQIRRFQSTLGSNFAKWYRRQTVQSLSLNPATKEFLQHTQDQLTQRLIEMLGTIPSIASQGHTNPLKGHESLWEEILDLCIALSLEIHGGDSDVSMRCIAVGSKYDEQIMTIIDDTSAHKNKIVKLAVSPLFIDDDQVILLPARVLLE
ncbi:uncharacterized protein BYT42DRAFT_521597 [Radiomyces spectabilis]|uniref:uncharacterized protein n=1 Tax=Radiomyces spectabilis TaxID=64574 RepID=UPI002220B92D|nr:uncharacterized protein BYT42DRAFT_521597 [Radiomyces spectabilis]KAI8369563.1 hypothetical protein BYT42DRAFT_521597 [Radiomyces spectabilis]